MGEISNALVVAIGMGNVFFGLIVIVLLCKIMSSIVRWMERTNDVTTGSDTSAAPAAAPDSPPPGNRQAEMEMEELAISAAFAEMLDTDISNIRITSFENTGGRHEIPGRQEIIAAVSAAIAELSGTDISAIRVVSFKQL